jgi:signal transduction histidine kinase
MNNIIVLFSLKNPEIANLYEHKRNSLIFFLVLLHAGFTCLTFLTCIFFSHKIAGPLYKLKKHLREIRSNGISGHLSFRKGDYFIDLADEVNITLDQVQEMHKNDLIYLGEVNSYINNLSLVVPDDKRIVLHEISSKLSEMQVRYVSKK